MALCALLEKPRKHSNAVCPNICPYINNTPVVSTYHIKPIINYTTVIRIFVIKYVLFFCLQFPRMTFELESHRPCDRQDDDDHGIWFDVLQIINNDAIYHPMRWGSARAFQMIWHTNNAVSRTYFPMSTNRNWTMRDDDLTPRPPVIISDP